MLFNLFWLNLLESVNSFCGMSRVAEWPRHAPLPLPPPIYDPKYSQFHTFLGELYFGTLWIVDATSNRECWIRPW